MAYPLLPVPDIAVRPKRLHPKHVCECGECHKCRNRVYAMNAYRRRKAGIPPLHGPNSKSEDVAQWWQSNREAMETYHYPDVDMDKVNAMWERVKCP